MVIWSWFAGKGCVLQPSSKIVDLGFVKFKSNGTKAKRPLEQIQKAQGAKKKSIFFCFLWGVLHGFSRKSNEDEFSRKSNGGWIFLGIKRGLQKKIKIHWLFLFLFLNFVYFTWYQISYSHWHGWFMLPQIQFLSNSEVRPCEVQARFWQWRVKIRIGLMVN